MWDLESVGFNQSEYPRPTNNPYLMKSKISLSLFTLAWMISLMALSTTHLHAEESGPVAAWGTDFSVALKQSEESGKPVLANFTGSDWCVWCVRLKKDLFDTSEFVAFADEALILLEVDFPSRKPIDPDLAAANRELAEKFGVEGFPTLLILDGKGNELGRHVGYFKGGVEAFSSYIRSLTDKSKP